MGYNKNRSMEEKEMKSIVSQQKKVRKANPKAVRPGLAKKKETRESVSFLASFLYC